MTRVTLINADVLEGLKTLPDESVQCTVTSPPYWGLRDYGINPVIWGGEPGCAHEWGSEMILEKCGKPTQAKGIFEGRNLEGIQSGKTIHQGSFCRLCGAWRGSYGLEPSVDCGRPFMELRPDLTDKEYEFVIQRLSEEGLL